MRNPWFQDWLALMRMFDQKQNAMETGFWRTTKQHNKNIFRKCLLNRMPIMLQPFASVRTQMSHVVVEIKNTKLVVARLAGTDANV